MRATKTMRAIATTLLLLGMCGALGCAEGAGVPEDQEEVGVVQTDGGFIPRFDLGASPSDSSVFRTPDVPTTGAEDVTLDCVSPLVACGGGCVNTTISPAHCGGCGRACALGQSCNNGTCATIAGCTAPQVMCTSGCADVSSDAANCGRCGAACGSGQTCVNGGCVNGSTGRDAGTAPVDTGPAPVDAGGGGGPVIDPTRGPGAACTSDANCAGATCIPPQSGWAGGYCSTTCTRSTQCGAGVCVATGATTGICLSVCRTNADCRSGYFCQPGTTVTGFCYPDCTSNPTVLCGEYACNPATRQCAGPTCTRSSAPTVCSSGSVCSGGYCDCTATTNCGPNRTCYPSQNYTCGCANDMACPPGTRCNTRTGACG